MTEEMNADDVIKELADVIQGWHSQKIAMIKGVLEDNKDELVLKFSDGETVMKGELLAGFRTGLHVAMMAFEKLPFELHENGAEDEEEDRFEDEIPPKPEGFGTFS